MPNHTMTRRVSYAGKLAAAMLLLAATLMAAASPAQAQGLVRTDVGVGFFYGSFNENPNTVMLVGGRAEDFCEADPGNPFNAEPGTAPGRIRERKDGSVRLRINSRHQPVHLYYSGTLDSPPWIESVCAEYFATGGIPDPYASGTAHLHVRITDFGQGNLDIFNSATGRAVAPDGTKYRVRGSAKFEVVNGELVGNPEEFVKFRLREVNNW